MTLVISLYLVWAFALAALLWWVMDLHGWRAYLGTVVYFAVALLGAVAVFSALSWPSPWHPAFHNTELLGVAYDEPRAIYVWVRRPGEPPRAFQLPWDETKAKALFRARQMNSEREGGPGTALSDDAEGQYQPHPRAFSAPTEVKP